MSSSETSPTSTSAVECYLSSILDIAEAMDAISPEISASYRERLMRLHAGLAANTTAQSLEDTRQALHELLCDFSVKARRNHQALARDLNQTLDMMARSEDSRSVRSVQYVERLVDFADQVENAVRSGDVSRLNRHTEELRGFAESIELDSHDAFTRLREKMNEIQHRLHEAELLATLDPLTGVFNRRELDRELAARVESGQEFCILLFDLDGFKAVNDEHGHL